ncbi:hypothetical protein AC481_00190 [miscellaneous Crenarchaeota group archaeon SMTZ-80]|nr:MAG: hypothetical protein AC481_00190 [miscellaneous Crenarchaeota group archaeon SMTZ-80]
MKKIIFQIRNNSQLIIILISIFSILFLYLKAINLGSIISQNMFFFYIFQILLELSAIFTLLFFPTYPIFFILLKDKTFKFREKIGICIVSNLSLYIVIGFIGSCFNLLITFEYFLTALTISYFSILLIAIFQDYHKKTNLFLRKTKNYDYNNAKNKKFSIFDAITKFISLNGILLTSFIILLCILNIVNTRFFAGTDAWLHISIVKYITDINSIPMNEYYGALGLHIFGAAIHFFSGLDLILLPKFYLFYTIPLSSLIIYNLLRRIFKNKNLAIFGVFLLFSSFGFTFFMMAQFWPSGIALIQGLCIFFVLYVRLQAFIKEKVPKKEDILPNMLLLYIILTIIFIGSFITHSLITMILLISYLWLYLIYFVKNYKRGIDFLLLLFFFGIFLIFYNLNISTGYFQVFNPFRILPWYFLLFGGSAAGCLLALFLLFYRKSIDFTRGIFRLITKGKKKKFYKIIEEKYLFPLIFGTTIILSSIFTFYALTFFKINALYNFYFADTLLIALFAIWGMLIFQHKPRGKIIFLWGIAIDLLFLIIFLLDAVIAITTFFIRIFHLNLIVIVIGFISYLYKLIHNNSFHKRRYKIFLIFIVSFSIFSSSLFDSTSNNIFFLREREVNSIEWYSNHTSNEKVIFSKFGWYAIFVFYDYPFEDKNEELELESIHYFLIIESVYMHPSSHITNGTNRLKELKSFYNREVILILPKSFYSPFSWQFFDQISEEEIEIYYNLKYLNRILCTKGENGDEIPYYWVI